VDEFRRAGEIDPAMAAGDAAAAITRHVARQSELVSRKGRVKPKRIAEMVGELPDAPRQALIAASPAAEGRPFVPLAALREGRNPNVMVLLKVLSPAAAEDGPIVHLVGLDAAGDAAGLSLCVVLAARW
jgi:hypothetical protein